MLISKVEFPLPSLVGFYEEALEEAIGANHPRTVPCGAVDGIDACTGDVVDPNDVEHTDGPSTLDAGKAGYGRDLAADGILGAIVDFSFNGTSYEATLGTSGADCSDGGTAGSADGCPPGVMCCRCGFQTPVLSGSKI